MAKGDEHKAFIKEHGRLPKRGEILARQQARRAVYEKGLKQKPVSGRHGTGTLNAKNNKGTVRHKPTNSRYGVRGGKIGPSQAGTGHAEK